MTLNASPATTVGEMEQLEMVTSHSPCCCMLTKITCEHTIGRCWVGLAIWAGKTTSIEVF